MDRFRLQRFVNAQDGDGTYERALAELRAGRKASRARPGNGTAAGVIGVPFGRYSQRRQPTAR